MGRGYILPLSTYAASVLDTSPLKTALTDSCRAVVCKLPRRPEQYLSTLVFLAVTLKVELAESALIQTQSRCMSAGLSVWPSVHFL